MSGSAWQKRETLSRRRAGRLVALAAALFAQSPVADAQGSPDASISARTLDVQQKASDLFERGDFARSEFIYRNELVPIGDKYAQYMIGFMYLTGQGLPRDPVRASAWYRLAAERNTPEFVTVRDDLLETFDQTQLHESDWLYLELKRQYSDPVLLMRLVRSDYRVLARERTGSLLSRSTSPVTVVSPEIGVGVSAEFYYGRLERRMHKRLDEIARRLDIEPVDTVDERTLDRLESHVSNYAGTVDDRQVRHVSNTD